MSQIWLNISNSKSADLFNLKYTTHVKPNRKGIIAHTAVSTGANDPLQIVCEQTNASTTSCMQECLDGLFGQAGEVNLRNMSVHSDRAYMLPSTVFEYLIGNGAEVVGTTKRMV